MKKYFISGILCSLALFLGSGCHSDEECEDAPTFPKQRQEAALKERAFVGDKPAIEAFDEVGKLLESGRALRFGVYQLGSHRDFVRGLPGKVVDKDERDLKTVDGSWEYRIDAHSLYEQGYDSEVYMNEKGVRESALKSDGFYMGEAEKYVKEVIGYEQSGRMGLFPYRMRRLVDSVEYAPGKVKRSVGQVGVAFASKVDGWPVIGPGGMVYVFMDPEGKLVGYQVYRKAKLEMLGMLDQSEIISPEEAIKALYESEPLEDYKIKQAEFGYYYDKRHSIREILAPAYVFHLVWEDGHSKGKYRVINAVRSEGVLGQRIQEDWEREEKRLESLALEAGEDSSAKEVGK